VKLRGNRLHVLLIDKGPRAAVLRLKIRASQPATVQRLLAPSVRSSSGVTLAGQTLAPNGKWTGRRHTERVPCQADHYSVTVRPYSAALFSVTDQRPRVS